MSPAPTTPPTGTSTWSLTSSTCTPLQIFSHFKKDCYKGCLLHPQAHQYGTSLHQLLSVFNFQICIQLICRHINMSLGYCYSVFNLCIYFICRPINMVLYYELLPWNLDSGTLTLYLYIINLHTVFSFRITDHVTKKRLHITSAYFTLAMSWINALAYISILTARAFPHPCLPRRQYYPHDML